MLKWSSTGVILQVTEAPAEHIVCLRAGWTAYETLLDELADSSAHRIAYDGETLEIMAPSAAHEKYIRLLEKLMGLLAHDRKMKIESFGSMTVKMKPRGAEPDSAYYIRNASAVVRKEQIDLAIDPPPDIALEVDLSQSRIDKQTICASMGIAEYWRYDGKRLRAFALNGGAYREIAESVILNTLPISGIDRFMEMRTTMDQTAIGEAWLEWLRSPFP